MKITTVEIYLLDGGEGMRPAVCRINTDEGISGLGEGALCFDSGMPAGYAMLKDLAPRIIGLDPMAHEMIWDKLFKDTFWGQTAGVAVFSAISAIDTALWDIKGKALGVPLYKLLGGKCRDKLRCYASQLQFGWGTSMNPCPTTAQLVQAAEQAVSEGYDAIKINFITFKENGERIGFLRGPIPYEILKTIEQRVIAVRKAIGEDVDIIVENHGRTDAVSIIEMCHMLEPYRIMYIEEVATPLHIDTMKVIRGKTNIPLAGGERIFSRWNFLNFFEADALQIAQPDVGTCGGITEAKKICDMAHAFDTSIQLHVCGSQIAGMASVHLEASLPNFLIHEHHVNARTPEIIGFCEYNYQPVNGYITPPELPGIGQELSKYAIEHSLMKCVIGDKTQFSMQ